MNDTQTSSASNAPVTQQTGETSTDVSPVSGPDKQTKPAQNGQDVTEASEEDNNAQPSGDPRPFNQGQPEQPDARG